MFLWSKLRTVCRVDNFAAVSRLSRQCGILSISQPYRPASLATQYATCKGLLVIYLFFTSYLCSYTTARE
jgi:hypothetical protein